jgi:hypothetical protein
MDTEKINLFSGKPDFSVLKADFFGKKGYLFSVHTFFYDSAPRLFWMRDLSYRGRGMLRANTVD